MDEAGITGALTAQEIGRRLKAAGDGALRRELLKGIREAAKPMIPAIRQGAQDRMPRSGGLADRLAAQKFAVRTSLASGSVKIAGAGMKEMKDIDKGRLRHPVFGNRKVWKQQAVPPGFFTNPIEIRLPEVRSKVDEAVAATLKKIGEKL